MKFIKKRKSVLIFSLVILIFILGLFQNPKISYAQPQFNNESLTMESNFEFFEFSDENGKMNNVTSVNIDLKSSRWNVTEVSFNFSSVKQGKVIKTVIDNDVESKSIEKFKGQGVQINISETTTLFGVYLYMLKNRDVIDPVYVQINGFTDDGSNKPNDTIYCSTLINVSSTEGWYFQNFTNPIELPQGKFYLVVNGTEFSSDTKYRWFHDKNNPENLYTHTSEFSGNWKDGETGEPFLYKLVQRVNRTYWPEDIEMAIEINGINYNVDNGANIGTGNVSVSNLVNFFPNNEILNVPIKNNESIELLFNLSYNIKLDNFLNTDGSALIKKALDNQWSVTPSLNRTDGNYSVEFDYPDTWKNLNVFKDFQNITDDLNITITADKLIIANDIISQGASWNITAHSPNVKFDATVPTTTYGPSQTMRITVTPPSIVGNFTFFLVDPYGDEEFSDTKENPIGDYEFEYTFSSNPFSGEWNAYILWNNQTDAGLQVLLLQINVVAPNGGSGGGGGGSKTVVTGIDPQLIYMTAVYIAIASLVGLSSYKMVKRSKRIKAEHREKVFNKYMDLLNLDYIMIIDKKSGLSVHDQILAGKDRDSSLISGFLEAIRTFGIDLTGSEEESQTISLQYQNMNIIMNDFKNFRILNIMKESPSQDFLDSLRPLSYDIDTYYGKSLKDFDGNVSKFRGVKDLLENHLHTSLIYPLKVIQSKETKLDSAEKSLRNKAQSVMKKNKSEYFYVSQLMGMSKEFNVKNAEIILKLIEKKVFRPIE